MLSISHYWRNVRVSPEKQKTFRALPGESMTQPGAKGLTLLISAFAIGIVIGWLGPQARCAASA